MSNLTDFIKSIVEEKKSNSINAFDSNEKIVSKKIDDTIRFDLSKPAKNSKDIKINDISIKKDSENIKHYHENKKTNSDSVDNYANNSSKSSENISYTYSVSDRKIVNIDNIEHTNIKLNSNSSIDGIKLDTDKKDTNINGSYVINKKYGSDNIVFNVQEKNKNGALISKTIEIDKKPDSLIAYEMSADIIQTNDISSANMENHKQTSYIENGIKRLNKSTSSINNEFTSIEKESEDIKADITNNKTNSSDIKNYNKSGKRNTSIKDAIENTEDISNKIIDYETSGKSDTELTGKKTKYAEAKNKTNQKIKDIDSTNDDISDTIDYETSGKSDTELTGKKTKYAEAKNKTNQKIKDIDSTNDDISDTIDYETSGKSDTELTGEKDSYTQDTNENKKSQKINDLSFGNPKKDNEEYYSYLEENLDKFYVENTPLLARDSKANEELIYRFLSQPILKDLDLNYYPAGSFKQMKDFSNNLSGSAQSIFSQWDSSSTLEKVEGVTSLMTTDASIFTNLRPKVVMYHNDVASKDFEEMKKANGEAKQYNDDHDLTVNDPDYKKIPYPEIKKRQIKKMIKNGQSDDVNDIAYVDNINEMRYNLELNDIHIGAATDPTRYYRGEDQNGQHVLKYDGNEYEGNDIKSGGYSVNKKKNKAKEKFKGLNFYVKKSEVEKFVGKNKLLYTDKVCYHGHIDITKDDYLKNKNGDTDFYGNSEQEVRQAIQWEHQLSDNKLEQYEKDGIVTIKNETDTSYFNLSGEHINIEKDEPAVGFIYVQEPFTDSNDNIINVRIPLQNNLTFDRMSRTATYNGIKFFKHFGEVKYYANTDNLEGISVSTKYFVESKDDNGQTNQYKLSSKYYTMRQLQKIELAYRSLVLPYETTGNYTAFSEASKDKSDEKYTYYMRPPIINIVLGQGGVNDNSITPEDSKYNSDEVFNNFFTDFVTDSTNSDQSNLHYKNFAVTNVTIEKNMDEQNYYVNDGKYNDAMGFTVTLELIEVDQDYVNSMPSFNSYYRVMAK